MSQQVKLKTQVRPVNAVASIIDIYGEINAFAEQELNEAYNLANRPGVKAIILNMSNLEYMNSSGIGLLVTLLIRANRLKQHLMVYGLSEHYQQIFELTRLSGAIQVYDTERAAVQAASA
ncbi:MAG TPA: STAS domain-containing protein [Chloroflexia bacterium]|nr:STAS domain-containing protein [Chloroflexia bacterium]